MDGAGRLRNYATGRELLYRDAHYLSVQVPVDPHKARRWLPTGVRLQAAACATLFTAWFPNNPFDEPYTEAGIFLHVRALGVRAVYCPWMLVSSSAALVAGRELLGYPKKLAEINITRGDDDDVVGEVSCLASRDAKKILRIHGSVGEEVEPSPFLGKRHINVRGNLGLPLARLVTFRPHEEVVSVREADLNLDVFNESLSDDLGLLDITRPTSGRLHRVNLGMSLSGFPIPIALVSPTFIIRNDALRNR